MPVGNSNTLGLYSSHQMAQGMMDDDDVKKISFIINMYLLL
jgi:hypothetical protein